MKTSLRTQVIRRPVDGQGRGRPVVYPYADLLKTVGTQQAVLLRGSRADLLKPVNSMRRKMAREHYRIRTAKHPEGLALWLEKTQA